MGPVKGIVCIHFTSTVDTRCFLIFSHLLRHRFVNKLLFYFQYFALRRRAAPLCKTDVTKRTNVVRRAHPHFQLSVFNETAMITRRGRETCVPQAKGDRGGGKMESLHTYRRDGGRRGMKLLWVDPGYCPAAIVFCSQLSQQHAK